MARIKAFSPVIVSWEDAVTVYEPAHSSEKFTTAERKTIGFLVSKDKAGVTVCMEDDRSADIGEHDIQTVTRIPARMIRKITVLAPKDPERKLRAKTIAKCDTIAEPDAVTPA